MSEPGVSEPGASSTGDDPARDLELEIARRHREAMVEGRSTYRDPTTGYQVFTAAFLFEREWCCGTHCRHCPY